MNWEAAGAIGEIIGALAVVLTLFYLSVQVRQNSKLAKATIRENRIDSSARSIMTFADAAEIVTKVDAGAALTAEESTRINLLFRAMFRDFEGWAYQQHAGLLDDSEWKAMYETWRDVLGSKAVRDSWEAYKHHHSLVLHGYLVEILKSPPTRP